MLLHQVSLFYHPVKELIFTQSLFWIYHEIPSILNIVVEIYRTHSHSNLEFIPNHSLQFFSVEKFTKELIVLDTPKLNESRKTRIHFRWLRHRTTQASLLPARNSVRISIFLGWNPRKFQSRGEARWTMKSRGQTVARNFVNYRSVSGEQSGEFSGTRWEIGFVWDGK